MIQGLVKGELDALRNGLGDGVSHNLVHFFLNSLGWVRGHLKSLTVEELGLESEVVSTSVLATVGASEKSLVSTLRESLALVSSEAEGARFLLSTFLNLALVLSHRSRELVVVVGASLDSVLSGGVTAVASSLLNLGLLLQGWDDGLSNMARLEVSINS